MSMCFLYHSVNSSSNNVSRGTVGLKQGEKKDVRTRIFHLDIARVFPKLGMTNGENDLAVGTHPWTNFIRSVEQIYILLIFSLLET